MYCPKCAAQNLDDAKYCRACGADISLVPQAVAGELAKKLDASGESFCAPARGREAPSIEGAFVSLFMGIAFVIIAFMLSQPSGGGNNWWFYMLIPAFIFLGKGVGSLIRLRSEGGGATPRANFVAETTSLKQPPRASALGPRETGEIITPPSVTEGTTRHLGVPVERKPRDV